MKKEGDAGPVRTMVVDEHAIVRHGLIHLLSSEPGFQICAEASSRDEASRMLEEERPELVILEFAHEGESGIGFVEQISNAHPDVSILVLSSEEETVYAEQLLKAGARGYIMKHASTAALMEAINRVALGELVVGDRVRDRLVERAAGRPVSPSADPMHQLTDREGEVFRLLGEGRSSREVAEKLDISIKTVETHRAKIMKKLDLDGASRLIHRAVTWVRFGRPGGSAD